MILFKVWYLDDSKVKTSLNTSLTLKTSANKSLSTDSKDNDLSSGKKQKQVILMNFKGKLNKVNKTKETKEQEDTLNNPSS